LRAIISNLNLQEKSAFSPCFQPYIAFNHPN